MIDKDRMPYLHGESNYLESRVLEVLKKENDLNDRQIAEALEEPLQIVNAICGQLVYKGKIKRFRVKGQPVQNHLI